MQLHGVALKLLDGVLKIFVRLALLMRGGNIVLRLIRQEESAVLKGYARLFLSSLHDICHGPKCGVEAQFVDGLQHIVAHMFRLFERHLLLAQIEEQILEFQLVLYDGSRHIGNLGEAVIVAVVHMHGVLHSIDDEATTGIVVSPQVESAHLSVEAKELAILVIDIERSFEDWFRRLVIGPRLNAYLANLCAVVLESRCTCGFVDFPLPAQHFFARNEDEVPVAVVHQDGSQSQEDMQIRAPEAFQVGIVEDSSFV